jgi:DNA invertase Pin-like site-specific DNA recombinase
MRKSSSTVTATSRIRCAIYTRKSTEEGLEQEFNSLDAQRESCEAYIASQKHEGWVCLPDMYDDGGISGATLERPALKRLLSDIDTHRIDAVVVYKVDRLTRSLNDFAKIVEVFDAHRVSFVSVTQQFNTTSSMGRLTLNMLLSFAQFEREVTAERIRDKIAASKRKGMWMGGNVPLGYDVKDRKLIINVGEAESVCHIYRRYAELGSVRTLKDELDRDGIVSKVRVNRYGRITGGAPFARGALYLLLQNRLYRGEIVHKEHCYPGLHQEIISEKLWDRVQRTLTANRIKQGAAIGIGEPSILKGLIHDATGQRMTPTHAVKAGRRYRYYVSRRLITSNSDEASDGQRIPAADIEPLVIHRIRRFLLDPSALIDNCGLADEAAGKQEQLVKEANDLACTLTDPSAPDSRNHLKRLVTRVQVLNDHLEITLDRNGLLTLLEPDHVIALSVDTLPVDPIILPVEARLSRTGIGKRMVLTDGTEPDNPNPSLIRLVARAFTVRQRLLDNTQLTLREIAAEEKIGDSYVTRLLRLSWLAPDIITAILKGKQPPELTARHLIAFKNLPIDWAEQKKALGFA